MIINKVKDHDKKLIADCDTYYFNHTGIFGNLSAVLDDCIVIEKWLGYFRL